MIDPPRSVFYDDVYFSAADGMAETRHVFLGGNDLPARWQGRGRFTVAETGFGTGLNFLTCWDEFDRTAPAGAFLDFISVEKYPLNVAQIRDYLSPWRDIISGRVDKLCAQYPMRVPGFHRMVFDGRVALTLIFGDVRDVMPQITARVDAWFLDGFTPAKNPDMWTPELYAEMARLSAPGAGFATFTAAGDVRRGLSAAGFTVEKTKGFAHKRDMLRGHYAGEEKALHPRTTTPRTVAIIGGGLAGTACAQVLREYGLTPTIYEQESSLATKGSGNRRGLFNPRFSAFRNAESDFYTSAFAIVARLMAAAGDQVEYGDSGALHLITDEERRKKLIRTAENWGWPADHMRVLRSAEASDVAGIPIAHAALYLPEAGYASPTALCAALARGTEIRTDTPIKDISALKEDAVILCNGVAAMDFVPSLKLHTVRGQVTIARGTERSAALKTALCYGGYVAPAFADGTHVVGASFQRWLTHTDLLAEDDRDNLAKLSDSVPAMAGLSPVSARAALRCSSHDRFPVIGAIDERVYVSAGHGSHGILSSVMGAHYLADLLRGGPLCLPGPSGAALHPARFLKIC